MATKQAELLEAPKADALAVVKSDAALYTEMIERLATNKDVDVEKLERLIAMHERVLDRDAEASFNRAFSEMQSEIPVIGERGKTDKTTYATFEDIVDVVRPILQRYGFSLGFETDWPEPKQVKVTGILTHRDGHARKSVFIAEADQTGSKNAIQALGSTVSYGRRYTTSDLLCIATRKADDDGNRATPQSTAPEGYEDWITDMCAKADEGTAALQAAWKISKREHTDYITKHQSQRWMGIKARAAKVRS